MECLLDAVSLPGKTSQRTDAEDDAANLQMQLEQLNRASRQELGDTIRADLKWNNGSRNALRTVKTESDLTTMLHEVASLRERTLNNLHCLQRTILSKEAWSPLIIEAWSQGGFISILSRKAFDYYQSLLQHLVAVAGKYSWEMAKLEIDFHVRKWMFIRVNSSSRIIVMCRIYVYLRDGSAREWLSPKLEAEKVIQLHTQVRLLEQGGRGGGAVPSGGSALGFCTRCGTILHGATECPWSGMNTTKAHKAGRAVLRKLASGGAALGPGEQQEE